MGYRKSLKLMIYLHFYIALHLHFLGIANGTKLKAESCITPPVAFSNENTEVGVVSRIRVYSFSHFHRKRQALWSHSRKKTQQVVCSSFPSGTRAKAQTQIHQNIKQVENVVSKQSASRGVVFASSKSLWYCRSPLRCKAWFIEVKLL